jgi:hypothetical protein
MSLNESIVEDAALTMPAATLTRPLPRREGWELGYAVGHGPHLAPGEPAVERRAKRISISMSTVTTTTAATAAAAEGSTALSTSRLQWRSTSIFGHKSP